MTRHFLRPRHLAWLFVLVTVVGCLEPADAAAFAAAPPTVPLPSGAEFLSPSNNISCEIDWHRAGLNETYCQTLSPPQSVTLTPHGALTTCSGMKCLGNPADGAPVLAYGTATGAGPFRCLSTIAGMVCTATGTGFIISRSGIQPVRAKPARTPQTTMPQTIKPKAAKPKATKPKGLPVLVDPGAFPTLSNAQALGRLVAIDRAGHYGEFLVDCGLTFQDKQLPKAQTWIVALHGLLFESETNPINPAAGSVETVSQGQWVTTARLHGWSGYLILEGRVPYLSDGPGTAVC